MNQEDIANTQTWISMLSQIALAIIAGVFATLQIFINRTRTKDAKEKSSESHLLREAIERNTETLEKLAQTVQAVINAEPLIQEKASQRFERLQQTVDDSHKKVEAIATELIRHAPSTTVLSERVGEALRDFSNVMREVSMVIASVRPQRSSKV